MTPVRRALLALALGGFGIGTGEFVMLGLLPNVAASLHISIPRAGNLISAYALGVVVGAVPTTAAGVRFARKPFLIVIALAMAVTNAASAAAPGFASALVLRFISGLPHGAYFGVASVVAGNLVRTERRSAAMSIVFAGLTVANVAGVPLATLIGQHAGWRAAYAGVAVIEVAAAIAIELVVPASHGAPHPRLHLRHELNVFGRSQIWLALGIAMIGGAALFCTFSYIAPMMIHLAHYSRSAITPLLVLFGIGMTGGNLIGARLADRALMRTIYTSLTAEAIVAALFFAGARNPVTAAIFIVLFPACAMPLLPSLQNRIVSLAGGAPNLAAASIHAAFNVANSIGAWIGGLAIAAGLGYAAPNLAAAGLAVLGLGVAALSGRADARAAAARSSRP